MHNHPKVAYTELPPLDDSEHAQNHPKVDYTELPPLDDSEHAQNHPKVDYTEHPILDDLETRSLSSKIGSYISSKFGWFHPLFSPNLDDIWQIIHIWMICVDHKSSIFGSGTYLMSSGQLVCETNRYPLLPEFAINSYLSYYSQAFWMRLIHSSDKTFNRRTRVEGTLTCRW